MVKRNNNKRFNWLPDEKIKEKFNNKSVREYQREKMLFLNNI